MYGYADIRLICAGKSMYEGRTLADFGVTDNATIHVVPRL